MKAVCQLDQEYTLRIPGEWLSEVICEHFEAAEVPQDAVIVLKLKCGEEVYGHQIEQIRVRWSDSEDYEIE